MTQTQSLLLSLPAEIRQCILRSLLCTSTSVNRKEKILCRLASANNEQRTQLDATASSFGRWDYKDVLSLNLQPQVLQVCRQLYGEGWPVLQNENALRLYFYHSAPTYQLNTISDAHPNLVECGIVSDRSLETARPGHLPKVVFDMQLEDLCFRHKYWTIWPWSLDLAKILKTKAVTFDIHVRPLEKTTILMDNPGVVKVLEHLTSLQCLRCKAVEVFINGTKVTPRWIQVMESGQAVKDLHEPCLQALKILWQVRAEGIEMDHQEEFEAELVDAMEAWDADEFRRLRRELFELVRGTRWERSMIKYCRLNR